MSYEYNFYLDEIMKALEIENQYQGIPFLDLQRILRKINEMKSTHKDKRATIDIQNDEA